MAFPNRIIAGLIPGAISVVACLLGMKPASAQMPVGGTPYATASDNAGCMLGTQSSIYYQGSVANSSHFGWVSVVEGHPNGHSFDFECAIWINGVVDNRDSFHINGSLSNPCAMGGLPLQTCAAPDLSSATTFAATTRPGELRGIDMPDPEWDRSAATDVWVTIPAVC